MPIDHRIILGLQPFTMPSPVEAEVKALSLRSMLDERAARELQMQVAQQGLADKHRRDAALQQFAQRLPEADREAFLVDPGAFMKARNQTHVLSPGGQLIRGDQVVAQAPDRPVLTTVGVDGQPGATQSAWAVPGTSQITPLGAPKLVKPTLSSLGQLISERDALPPGDPRRAAYDQTINKTATHQPAASTVVNVQGKEADKHYGKFLGETFGEIQKAGMSAPGEVARYQQLGNLLGQVSTGRFAGTTVNLKAAAKGLGVNIEALGIRDDIAPAQAAAAIGNQLALELRNPAGGAGMPGAMSDADREFLRSMIPSIENDPKAIPMMIDARVRVAKRNQQVAQLSREYAQRNGGNIDSGFFEQLSKWSEANPVFPEAGKGGPAAPRVRRFNPQTGRIE